MSSLPRFAIALAVAVTVAGEVARAERTTPRDDLQAPILTSIEGGLRMGNFRLTSLAPLSAYPLLSPPAAGFTPLVAVSLTDRQGDDDFDFYAIKSPTRVGNAIGSDGAGSPYTFLATLDSGGQSHILSYADSLAVNLASANRDGPFTVEVRGAGPDSDFLFISDPLGIFVTGANNATVSGGQFHAPATSFKGQVHTSVLTTDNDLSQLPSIVGVPMLANYAVNIRNSQTRRIVKPDGLAVRTPTIDLVNHGAATQRQFKLNLDLEDGLSASTAEPAFFPSFSDFNNFSADPGAPTFWTFPICNVELQNADSSFQTNQRFLFDTGAQVTVLSEAVADSIGFDVGVTEADFEIDVLGVGGPTTVKGYFIPYLELPVIGGDLIYRDVPIIVLNITDPRDGSGFVPGIIGMNLFTDRDLSLDMNRSGESYVQISAPITPQWNVNGNGAWLPDANWDLGVPDGTDVPANFLGAITAARTVTVDGDYTIGSMKFDNLNSYTLAGPGRLTFSTLGRPSKIEVVKGDHIVSSPMTFNSIESPRMSLIVAAGSTLTLSGDTASPEADVTKSGLGVVRLKNARYQSLAIDAGTVRLLPSTDATDGSSVESLSIAAGASLDLTNRRMIVDYETDSPLLNIRAHLAAGRITSSVASTNTAVGFGEAAGLNLTSFGGLSIVGDAVVMRLTLKGDADLSGAVGFDDLLALAQNYGLTTGRFWTTGDFDYDGEAGFNDLLALAQNYNGTFAFGELPGGKSFAADWALAQSLVPEPAGLFVVGLLLVRRGRR